MRTPPLNPEVFTSEPLKTYLEVAKQLKSMPRRQTNVSVSLASTPSSSQSSGTEIQPCNCDAVAGTFGTSVNLVAWTKVCEQN